MTGHELILKLRRAGKSPRTVWVNDYHCEAKDGTTVSLSPRDVPEQQDWRFLVGLTALVSGEDEARVQRIAQSCGAFAKRVIASVHSPSAVPWGYGATAHPITKVTDTQGVLTWPT